MIKLKSIIDSINEAQMLFESPMRMGALNIDQFENHGDNFAYSKTIKEKASLIDKFKNYEIYQYVVSDKIFDVIINGDFTVAFFNYKVQDDFMIEEKVWQDPLYMSLCRMLIFEYYIKKFKGIISDGLHSFLGERYWKKLLKQSMESGYKTYVLKDEKDKIPLTSPEEIDQYFSNGSEGLRYRFVIEK